MLRTIIASCMLFGVCHAEESESQIPFNFMQDVLFPLGGPFVSSYHSMRENIFLNTRTDHDTAFEAIGNFFLVPSQYLFAGKNVSLQGGEWVANQTYDYGQLHWLKTLGSLVALPVGEILGATFKGLAYLSCDVRQKHDDIRAALFSASVKAQDEEYRRLGLPPLHCEEFIPCQGHQRPSRLSKKQYTEIQALREIARLLDENKITYWVDCGTCLGAYRHGGIIPWDWDIDLAILMPDHDNVKKVLSALDPDKYQVQDWSSYDKPKTYLKVYVKETKNFIDIYHYQINAQERTVNYLFTYIDSTVPVPESWRLAEIKCIDPVSYEDMFPLKKATFDGIAVWAPNNVVAFLQSKKYGTNLDPAKVWDEESKSYKKVENHPYYQQ